MEIKDEFDFRDLMNKCWSGAKDTLEMIEDKGYEDELMSHLEDVFYGDIPTMTEVNDYLWFEEDAIKEALGIFELEEKVNLSVLKTLKKDVEGAMKIDDISDELTQSLNNLSDQLDYLEGCDSESEFDDTHDEIEDIRNIIYDIVIENEEGGKAFQKDIQKNIIDVIDDDLYF